MTRPQLIALTGPAGAGKDSVAAALERHAGFTPMAFANALRREVCAAFSIPLSYLVDRACKEHPITALALTRCADMGLINAVIKADRRVDLSAPRSPRQIMRWWGTEYRRQQNQSYWIDQVAAAIALREGQGPIVITDVRFADEAQAVRSWGGVIWQVERPGFEVPVGANTSETAGASFNPSAMIVNDGDLDDLTISVMQASEMCRGAAA